MVPDSGGRNSNLPPAYKLINSFQSVHAFIQHHPIALKFVSAGLYFHASRVPNAKQRENCERLEIRPDFVPCQKCLDLIFHRMKVTRHFILIYGKTSKSDPKIRRTATSRTHWPNDPYSKILSNQIILREKLWVRPIVAIYSLNVIGNHVFLTHSQCT